MYQKYSTNSTTHTLADMYITLIIMYALNMVPKSRSPPLPTFTHQQPKPPKISYTKMWEIYFLWTYDIQHAIIHAWIFIHTKKCIHIQHHRENDSGA